MSERDKFLTEAMGLCWHEWDGDYSAYDCKLCKNEMPRATPNWGHIDFSTWAGFGSLWEWAQQQEWWGTFSKAHSIMADMDCMSIWQVFVHPCRFADALYDFLKARPE